MADDLLLYYNLQFFAKDGEGGEKTEEPTAKKKTDTRNEGRVAKSKEVSNAASLIVLFLCLRAFVSTLGNQFNNAFHWAYNLIPGFVKDNSKQISIIEIRGLISHGVYFVLMACLPFFIAGIAVSLASNIFQFGFKVTWKPMQPSLSKFNPISGFKRLFSKDSLFELLKSIIKIALIFVIAYTNIRDDANNLLLLYDIDLFQAIGYVGNIIIDTGFKISMVYIIVAAADFFYQRWKFNEDLKMTKQEVKDEYKNTEGDPQIKGRQKQRMAEASRRRMMSAVPQADVVITNPTHLAVALKYEENTGTAPVVVAKGADYVAARIKEIARDNNVEIVENKVLARTLYMTVDIGQEIPPELYQSVAEILASIYNMRRAV